LSTEELDDLEFWNTYDWNWKSPIDVETFVRDALDRNVYEYAWGTLADIGEENFYTNWWCPVQSAIEQMGKAFSEEDLKASIKSLLEGNGEGGDSDPSILDALLKYIPGFPRRFPEFNWVIDEALPEYGYSDWWEFSWYPFIGRYLTWTFWGPETLARSQDVDPIYLHRIFKTSLISDNPYKTFRARVALASNPNCPKEIIEFLFENRDTSDWLLQDIEEEGVLELIEGKYQINENCKSTVSAREVAKEVLHFTFPTTERWDSCPGAYFVGSLLDIEWEADSARTCLLAALSKNVSLRDEMYLKLSQEQHPLIKYFLSKNSSINKTLKTLFFLDKPTFTFQPYGSSSSMVDEITLS